MTVTVVREPLYRTVPDCRDSFGDLARKVGTDLGLPPDEEQQAALDAIFAESRPSIPRYRHACLVGPRQNIKSSTLTIASATDLYVLGVPGAVWTAHQSKTATKSYQDLSARIRGNPEYADLTDFRAGRGEEVIYLPGTDISLEYRARSGGSGRGFTTGRLTLDEALYLRPGDLGALLPTMLTRADAQVRYGSSAGLRSSQVLRDLRDAGRAGTDPGLWYAEYGSEHRDCADPACQHALGTDGCALDDRELWWQGNSALWCGRIREEDIADLRRRMPPAEFAREVLVWWDDPPSGGAALSIARWEQLVDQADMGQPVFAVATAPDRSWSAVSAAWTREDGNVQVELVDYQSGSAWVGARATALRERWGAIVLVTSGARGLVPDAQEPSQQEQAQAHNALADAIETGTVRHGNQPALNVAVSASRWRPLGDTRVLDRKGSADISPIDAAALAMHGLTTTSTSGGWMVSLP